MTASAWFSILVALVGEVLVSLVSAKPLMDVGSTGMAGVCGLLRLVSSARTLVA